MQNFTTGFDYKFARNKALIGEPNKMNSPKYQIVKLRSGQYFFRLTGPNNEVLLTSGHYIKKQSCKTGIKLLMLNSQIDTRYEQRETKTYLYFRLQTATSQLLGISGLYQTKEQLEHAIDMVKRIAMFAEIEDLAGE